MQNLIKLNVIEIIEKSLLGLLLFPFIALGAPILDGAVKQDTCSYFKTDFKFGNIDFKADESSVKNKVSSAGKSVEVGDTIFYVDIIRQRKNIFYEAVSDITLKRSFLYSDTLFAKGTKLNYFGSVKDAKTNIVYSLLTDDPGNIGQNIAASYAVIKENGFLCSGEVLHNFNGKDFISENETYQKDPLIRNETIDWTHEEAIAINIVKLGDISAILGVKLLKNGVVVQEKNIEINTLQGYFEIAGFWKMTFDKSNKSSIKILSISEPSNYGMWLQLVESQLFRTNG